MRITLLRHGEAGEAARDGDRALTLRGRASVRHVARVLHERGTRFDLIVASPLVRAVQTAEILAEVLRHPGEVVIDPVLVPEGSPREVRRFLGELDAEADVALVAHEPILSSTLGLLLGKAFSRGLRKSEAIRVRLPTGLEGGAELRWSLTPDRNEVVKFRHGE